MSYPTDVSTDTLDRANESIRRSFITGTALTIPLIVTLLVFGFVVRTITDAIAPLVEGMNLLFGIGDAPEFVVELFTLVMVFWFVLAVGFVAERRSGRESRVAQTFNELIAEIPGVGSVYTGVKQMSEVILSSDSESFRAVKLVEFPHASSYMLCFVTATPPPTIEESTGQGEMRTLFVPLAPNPVMGGFLVYVSADRVYDIDMTVEQGMRAIMTSGVAVDPRAEGKRPTAEEVRRELEEGGYQPIDASAFLSENPEDREE